MRLIPPSRRGFLTGLVGLIAAPAIVKASSLMPISVQPIDLVPKSYMNYGVQARAHDTFWRWVQLDTFGGKTEYYISNSFSRPNPERFYELHEHATSLGYTLQDKPHGYE